MSVVRFRREALRDIGRYEAWRESVDQGWQPIADTLLSAIQQTVARYASFDDIPAVLMMVRGQPAPVKRMLVPVRSKAFRVYVGPGRHSGEITVRRVRHPSQEPLEG